MDRASPLLVTIALFLIVAAGVTGLAYAGSAMAVVAAVTLGLGIVAEVDLVAFLVGRYFAPALYRQTYGALSAVFLVGGAIGPAVSGYLQQATGDYRLSLYGAVALLLCAAAMAALLSRRSPVLASTLGQASR